MKHLLSLLLEGLLLTLLSLSATSLYAQRNDNKQIPVPSGKLGFGYFSPTATVDFCSGGVANVSGYQMMFLELRKERLRALVGSQIESVDVGIGRDFGTQSVVFISTVHPKESGEDFPYSGGNGIYTQPYTNDENIEIPPYEDGGPMPLVGMKRVSLNKPYPITEDLERLYVGVCMYKNIEQSPFTDYPFASVRLSEGYAPPQGSNYLAVRYPEIENSKHWQFSTLNGFVNAIKLILGGRNFSPHYATIESIHPITSYVRHQDSVRLQLAIHNLSTTSLQSSIVRMRCGEQLRDLPLTCNIAPSMLSEGIEVRLPSNFLGSYGKKEITAELISASGAPLTGSGVQSQSLAYVAHNLPSKILIETFGTSGDKVFPYNNQVVNQALATTGNPERYIVYNTHLPISSQTPDAFTLVVEDQRGREKQVMDNLKWFFPKGNFFLPSVLVNRRNLSAFGAQEFQGENKLQPATQPAFALLEDFGDILKGFQESAEVNFSMGLKSALQADGSLQVDVSVRPQIEGIPAFNRTEVVLGMLWVIDSIPGFTHEETPYIYNGVPGTLLDLETMIRPIYGNIVEWREDGSFEGRFILPKPHKKYFAPEQLTQGRVIAWVAKVGGDKNNNYILSAESCPVGGLSTAVVSPLDVWEPTCHFTLEGRHLRFDRPTDLCVFNLLGTPLLIHQAVQSQSIESLPAGIYILSIQQGASRTVEKLILQ